LQKTILLSQKKMVTFLGRVVSFFTECSSSATCQYNDQHAWLSDTVLMGTSMCLVFQLVEKMMEQARENVSAKNRGRGLRRCGSAMW
jgi:hypothetical protein